MGNEREYQFGFTASLDDHPIPDIGSRKYSGGSCALRTIEPGKTFEAEVDLKKWFKFEKPGRYVLTGTYHMSFRGPDPKDHFLIWEDYATACFFVTVSEK